MAARAWRAGQGGVEGTGSYGAGLARYLAARGVEVAGVIWPTRQARRQRGTSDTAGAVAAALAALSGAAAGVPKSRGGAADSIRALRVARAGAVNARTQAGHQLRDLILTAPEQVRHQLAGLSPGPQVHVAAGSAPTTWPALPRVPGRRWPPRPAATRTWPPRSPGSTPRSKNSSPAPPRKGSWPSRARPPWPAATLLATTGGNPSRVRKEARFAARCGARPVDTSPGKQIRHRLNRGGDRQANPAPFTLGPEDVIAERSPSIPAGASWPMGHCDRLLRRGAGPRPRCLLPGGVRTRAAPPSSLPDRGRGPLDRPAADVADGG